MANIGQSYRLARIVTDSYTIEEVEEVQEVEEEEEE